MPSVTSSQQQREYAQMILTTPDSIRLLAEKARCRLACADLPTSAPLLLLSSEARRTLQYDCLYRFLQTTSLIRNLHLLHILATWCITQGLADGILEENELCFQFWIHSIAEDMYRTSLIPGSWLHALHHQWSDSTRPASRTRSASDPEARTTPCNCLPPTDAEQRALAAIHQQLSRLKHECENGSDEDVEDYQDGDEDAEDMNELA